MCFIQLKFYCLSMVNSYRDGYTVLASSRLLAILDPARFGARPCAEFFYFYVFFCFLKKMCYLKFCKLYHYRHVVRRLGPNTMHVI
jgi:hypothetical protein